ncbi:hypothetical protein B0H11DRAFT_2053152 [Mycena galericulata]|nr:hypothetical protein B0H11DRAFT_2053152 [Mycena galericulata]
MLSTLPMSPSPPSLNGLFYPPTSFKRTSPHNSLLGAVNLLLPVPLTFLSLLAWHALFCLISCRVYVNYPMLLLSYMPYCSVSATLTQFLSLTASPTLPQSRSHQLRRCPIPPVLFPVIHRLDGLSRPLRLLPFHLYHRTLLFRIVILMMHPSIIPLRTSMGPGRP